MFCLLTKQASFHSLTYFSPYCLERADKLVICLRVFFCPPCFFPALRFKLSKKLLGEPTVMIYTVTLNPALDKTVQILVPSGRGQPDLGHAHRPRGKGINVSKVLRELGEPSGRGHPRRRGRAEDRVRAARSGSRACTCSLGTRRARTSRSSTPRCTPTPTSTSRVPRRTKPSFLSFSMTDRLRPGDLVVLSGKAPAARRIRSTATGSGLPRRRCGRVSRRRGRRLQGASPAGSRAHQAQPGGALRRDGPAPYDRGRDDPGRAGKLLAQGVGCVAVTMGAGGALFCAGRTAITLRCESPRVPVDSTVARRRQHRRGATTAAAFARVSPARAMATGATSVMCSGTQAARLVTSDSSCRRCASPEL